MRWRSYALPAGVFGVAFAALCLVSTQDAWLRSIGAESALKEWKVQLNVLLSGAFSSLAALIKKWYASAGESDGTEVEKEAKEASKDPGLIRADAVSPPKQAQSTDWREE